MLSINLRPSLLSKIFLALFVITNLYALVILSLISKIANHNLRTHTQILGASTSTNETRPEANWRQYVHTNPQNEIAKQENYIPLNNLNAWWSNMEYGGKIITSVYADKLISCKWQLTLLGETGQIISRTSSATTDTCKFEANTYFKPYKLWVRAKSLDGETHEFGVK